MNFKFRKSKLVTSIVIPLLIWIILAFVNENNLSSNLLIKVISLHNYDSILSYGNIFLFLIEVIIVFLIISLFHRKYY
jgi:hypothetical protein